VTEPVGHRHAHRDAVELALELGITRLVALAAPVVVGMMLVAAARARRRSLCGKSRMTWSLV
jgi:membrane glycosyltransferase